MVNKILRQNSYTTLKKIILEWESQLSVWVNQNDAEFVPFSV